MKKIIVVTLAEPIGKKYWRELNRFFGDDLQIDRLTCAEVKSLRRLSYDMVLISDYRFWEEVKDHLNYDAKVVKIIKNLNPEGIRQLEKVPYGVSGIMVNVGPYSANESINLVYSHGRTDLNLRPYYPQAELPEGIECVLTQGELALCPVGDWNVVDLFATVIDVQIYWEIILGMGLSQQKYGQKLADLGMVSGGASEGFSYMISKRVVQDGIINALFENMNEGVVMFDTNHRVINCSATARKYLGLAVEHIFDRDIQEILPLEERALQGFGTVALTVNGQDLLCDVVRGVVVGEREIGIVVLKKLDELQSKIRRHTEELLRRGYRSKYTLDDIVGKSDAMCLLKERAVRMAANDATIMITGESGTGKELIAHIIHAHSPRYNKQFVAINCASIPETLMESEIFGYEEGSFTGAKKGGKSGIFEMAANGSLFLDEIGEIPLHLQNRLLRVLQEREVTRVGGHSVISVDVRVIAATNLDLRERVKTGQFRKDLYYRLCVLPLYVPPLRERGDDALEIFRSYCQRDGRLMVLTPEVQALMVNHPWDGNIRELRNCYEYLKYLGVETVTVADLPDNMRDEKVAPLLPKGEIDAVSSRETVSYRQRILALVESANRRGETVGRKKLSRLLAEENCFMGEQEVRNELLKLAECGYLLVSKGRGGTRITQEGQHYLRTLGK